MLTTPVTLTIAGFDTSAGAGLQADLKTFTALGTYGLTATTCTVTETANEVRRVDAIDAEILAAQLDLLLASYPIAAIKLGMLYDLPQMEVTRAAIHDLSAPIIIDPVMISSTGDPLFQPRAMDYFTAEVLPLASVITPNAHEAAHLLGRVIDSPDEAHAAARELARTYEAACLLKGGHLDETAGSAIDYLALTDDSVIELAAPRIDIISAHGTGCTLAAALTAHLAHGEELPAAAARAKDFVHHAMATAHRWTTHGISAINQSLPTTPAPRVTQS